MSYRGGGCYCYRIFIVNSAIPIYISLQTPGVMGKNLGKTFNNKLKKK